MGMQTILLVEDEESFIDALTIGLKKEGFRVEVARDGMEALAKFDSVRPDLVLLDVMLPKISGIDVCRQLRKNLKCRSLWSRRKVPKLTLSSVLKLVLMTTSLSHIECAN